MRVTILGIPGAGKTELGKELADRRGWRYYGGGEVLRRFVQSRAPGWQVVDQALRERRDTEPGITLEALRREVVSIGTQRDVILDGFPKRRALVPEVDEILGASVDLALQLVLPVTLAARRIQDRLVCNACGRATSAAIRDEGTPCPRCNEAVLSRRPGDSAETLLLNARGSEPPEVLAAYYSSLGRLVVLDAAQAPEAVVIDAEHAIEARLAAQNPQ